MGEMRFLIIIYTLFVVISIISISHCLICSDVLEMPTDKKLTLSEIQTLQPKDIIDCLAHLGKEPLSMDEANFIWISIIRYYDGIVNIPNTVLMILHWVTAALTPEDYGNMTLDNIDVVDNFGLNYNLRHEQLTAIANRVREDFAGKSFEDYTYYDLMALKQILCVFNRSEIERIHPSAYREAAIMIGKLENCGAEPMSAFASLAMNASAFGSPENWTAATITTMGKVAEYLPQDLLERFKIKFSDNESS